MTIIEAIKIDSEFDVKIKLANMCGKEPIEAVKEVAEKYTVEKLAEAYSIIRKQKERELGVIDATYALAIRSKTFGKQEAV